MHLCQNLYESFFFVVGAPRRAFEIDMKDLYIYGYWQ